MVYYRNFLVIYMLQIEHLIKQIFFMVFVSIFMALFLCQTLVTWLGTLFAFSLVCIGVIVLRKTNPDAERGFRVPFVPVFYCRCYYLSNFDGWYH
jgi:amino acid transporter